jgi:hypothetical protein
MIRQNSERKTMSKRRPNTILEIPYEISNEPENVAEAVALCGGDEKALLEHFVQKLVYNHHNSELRSAFLERVEEKSGIARQVEKKEKGTDSQGKPRVVEVYSETEGEYFARVLAERAEKPSDYTPLLQETADGYKDGDGKDVPGFPLDGTKKARGAGGPKLAKMYISGAEEIEKAGKLAAAASKLAEALGLRVDPTVDSVARALKEREDRRRSEFVKELI